MLAVDQGGQDADLAARIVTLDVGCRIFFGVPVLLRHPQHRIEIQTVVDHFGQDEIGRSVQNAVKCVDLVGGQTLRERTQDGDTAAHAGLKQEIDVVVFGDLQQDVTFCRDQFLIG